ncbi:MAG: guanylate kinase [Armatimonadetes bacterium]|nr:guanylate kinase [Candidatus Hippobium faecium]
MIFDKYINKKGICFVLSGPSGIGKDTVLEYLKKDYPLNKVVTATTRAKRPGETDGVDYDFMTPEEFEKKIAENYFLEYASFSGNYYGTPKANAEKLLGQGKNALLKIEVQGAVNVKKLMPEAVLIFLAPSSMELLEERLRGRGTDKEEDIIKRLETAKKEMEYIKYYDYLIINENSQETAKTVKNILVSQTYKVSHN